MIRRSDAVMVRRENLRPVGAEQSRHETAARSVTLQPETILGHVIVDDVYVADGDEIAISSGGCWFTWSSIGNRCVPCGEVLL